MSKNTESVLSLFWVCSEPVGNLLGTCWEPVGNQLAGSVSIVTGLVVSTISYLWESRGKGGCYGTDLISCNLFCESCQAIGSPTPLSSPKILDKTCQVTSLAGTKSAVKNPKICHSVPYSLTSLTLRRSGHSNSPRQHVIPHKRHLHNGAKKMGWFAHDTVTFCPGEWSTLGVSLALGAKIISWRAMATLWNVTCATWLTWIEYDGTSKRGSGLWNMSQWALRTSQSGWEIRSWVFRPLTEANSNGPWMNMSWCVKITHLQKGSNLCQVA